MGSVPGFDWRMPVALRFGSGCSGTLVGELGDRRALVLAFEPAGPLGLRADWTARLDNRLLDWVTVPEGLSTLAVARQLAARVWPLLAAQPDAVLLALGGGSVLDLAKLLRSVPAEGGFEAVAAALRGTAPWPPMRHVPLWLVPTTAGTGSEVTRWATVWDTDGPVAEKRSFDEPWGFAERAFVDPSLTLSAPAVLTRDTALDSFAHALEALWNRHANPVSDALAVQAARRVRAHLAGVLEAPTQLAGREQLALAALEAGLAFAQTRTALAHALSYALTLEQGVPHGLAVAAWLPTACRLAAGRDARVDTALEAVFGVPAPSAPAALQQWLQCLGVPCDPADHGVSDAEARVGAALASARGRNFIGATA
ncbi:MAG: iron-containing alcohol dehydrogenase [Betaproteobacteria bacterium]|jgi:phosphonate metabolism-associated iron-containing alcohol dehydrogenase|nr:iron-containing alcohol dehydrogenase [Rubrivivax sp.]